MSEGVSITRQTVAVLSLALVLVGAALFIDSFSPTPESTDAPFADVTIPEHIRGRRLTNPVEAAEPVRIAIPDIGVNTSFVELGIAENNEIEIPETFEEVGWYQYGPTPGELGPSVVLGHVDSREGPAVFYSLGQLERGDTIEIERADGTVAVFEVDALERYPQERFPTSLVYGDLDYAGLRLITCSGSYIREEQRYDHNLIVYASLLEVR